MKLAVGQAQEVRENLKQLSKSNATGTIKAKIHHVIKAIDRTIEGQEEAQQELIEEHGEQSGGGMRMGPEVDGFSDYLREWAPIANEEVEVEPNRVDLPLSDDAVPSGETNADIHTLIELGFVEDPLGSE